MKPATLPLLCGLALTAMSAASVSHWWTVREFVATIDPGDLAPKATTPALPQDEPPLEEPEAEPMLVSAPLPPALASGKAEPAEKEFFEALVGEIRSLRGENRDLRDQMAETNRDLMKLEFRVDTHSESFRPLPVSEERFDTTFDEGLGVLPPRATPVFLPGNE